MNITHNFAQTSDMLNNQPLSVLPTELAKKLLRIHTDSNNKRSFFHIMAELSSKIHGCNSVAQIKSICAAFIKEWDLIEAVATKDWDTFTVPDEI